MDPKERAKELGIDYNDDISEEELSNLISEKEKELETDVEFLKKELDKYRVEAKKAFDKRDQFKKDRDKLSTKIKDLENSMKNMISSDEKTQMEEELKELKEFKKDYDKKQEEKELKNKTEVERLELQLNKKETEFSSQVQSLREQLDSILDESKKKEQKSAEEIKRLRTHALKADVMEVAAQLDAFSPMQIFKLTKDDFTYDSDLDKYTWQKRDSSGKLEDEKTVKEYIEDFLKSSENENLIKSKANTKGFDTKFDTKNTKVKNDMKTSKEFDPKDPKIISDARFHNLDPEEYISKMLIPQREKFNKRYKKTE